jgi:DHA2 family multidrug resistance protein
VLEEGNKDDWFGSPFIVKLAVIAAASLTLFIWIELVVEKPLIRLRLLDPAAASASAPSRRCSSASRCSARSICCRQYLGQVQRYNAEQIGQVLAWTGLPQLMLIPLVPKLMQRFDARFIAFTGIAAVRGLVLHEHPDVARLLPATSSSWPNIVRAIGQAMVLAPLSAVRPRQRRAAGCTRRPPALSNMMRNLGGAIGTALLSTIVTKREQFHSNIIGQSVHLGREEVRTRIAEVTNYFLSHGVADPATAHNQAIVAIGNVVQKQAYILAFSDTFYLLGAALIVALAATLLLKKPGQLAGGGAH